MVPPLTWVLLALLPHAATEFASRSTPPTDVPGAVFNFVYAPSRNPVKTLVPVASQSSEGYGPGGGGGAVTGGTVTGGTDTGGTVTGGTVTDGAERGVRFT